MRDMVALYYQFYYFQQEFSTPRLRVLQLETPTLIECCRDRSWQTVKELDCQSGLGWDAQSTHVRGQIAQLFSSLALPLGPAVEPA